MIPSNAALDRYRTTDMMSCDPDMLTDLRDVHIDTSLPVRERMESYLRQVHNPYLVKADGLIIRAVYVPGSGRSLIDALAALMIP